MDGTALPADIAERVANVAKWFPEVLLTLGAPDLEERFHPVTNGVLNLPQGKMLEVVLQRRPESTSLRQQPPLAATPATLPSSFLHAAARPPVGAQAVVERLETLAGDFERLSACLAAQQAGGPRSYSAALPVPTLPLMFSPPGRGVSASVPSHCGLQGGLQNATSDLRASAGEPPSVRKGDTPGNTPASARGDRQARQVHQGASRAHSGKARPGRAAAWRQDQALKIAITKVPQLETEPASPKMATQAKVWSKTRRRSAESGRGAGGPDDRDQSPNAFKQKIETKLKLLLGETNVDRSFGASSNERPPARRHTLFY